LSKLLRTLTLKEDMVFKRTIRSHLVTTQPLRRVQHLQVQGGRSAESNYGFEVNLLFPISFSLLHNSARKYPHFQAFYTSSFRSLAVCKSKGRRPGEFHHV